MDVWVSPDPLSSPLECKKILVCCNKYKQKNKNNNNNNNNQQQKKKTTKKKHLNLNYMTTVKFPGSDS